MFSATDEENDAVSSIAPRKRVIALRRVIHVPGFLALILLSNPANSAADGQRPPSFRTDIAPLLSKLLTQQAATGLPPPYLPMEEVPRNDIEE